MKKVKFLTAILLLVISLSVNADWLQTNGPVGGDVNAFAVNGNLVFAGLNGWGVRYSTNNGVSWLATNMRSGSVNDLAYNSGVLYAAISSAGISKSTDNGQTWYKIFSLGTVLSVLARNNIVLAGYNNQGIYRSTNNGTNWIQTNVTDRIIYAICESSGHYFAGGYPGGLYTSIDNGATWSLTSLTNQQVGSLAVNGNNIYAGTNSGVYASSDLGATWTQIGLTNVQYVRSLAVLGNTLVAGTLAPQAIYYSTNSGINWIQSFNRTGEAFVISGSNIFAGTYFDGIYISTNSGMSWLQEPLLNTNCVVITAIGNNIFSGGDGIYRTTDGGNLWNLLPANGANSLVNDGTNLVASSGSGVYRSTDLGNSWVQIRNNVSTIFSVAVSGGAIIAGEDSYSILRSTDNGVSWIPGNIVNVRLLASNGNYVFARNVSSVYVSSNSGLSFNSVSFGGSTPICFAAGGNDVYAGTNNTGVYHSTDNGFTWTSANLSGQNVPAIAVVGSNVFAATRDAGVFLSTNSGAVWQPVNDGLGGIKVRALYSSGGYIYAGTSGYSVWKRALSELLGIQPVSNEIPKQYSLSQNYPNPFNPSTKIKFQTPLSPPEGGKQEQQVSLKIYDVTGREVETLVNEQLNAGTYEVTWSAANYSSGVYFYKLVSGSYINTKKMILIK